MVIMKSDTHLVNLILRRGNVWYNLLQLIKKDDGSNFPKAVKLLSTNPDLKKEIWDKLLPQKITHVYPHYLDGAGLWKTLLWYSNIINVNADILSSFDKQKQQFEKMFVLGRYDEAYQICQNIKNEFGLSLWLLDAYGLLKTYSGNEYDFEENMDSGAKGIYSNLQIKNIRTERQDQYVKRVSHLLSTSNIDSKTRIYYKYKLFAKQPFDEPENAENNWREILLIEGCYSIIDIYLVTLDCIQYYVYSRNISKSNYLSKCIKLLSNIDTEACRLTVASFNKEDIEYTKTEPAYSYIDLITSGKFNEIYELFSKKDTDSYNNFNAYIYAAISALLSNEPIKVSDNCICQDIIYDLCRVLKKENEETVYEAYLRLSTLSRTLRSFTLHKGLCIFLSLEFAYDCRYTFGQQLSTFGDDILLEYEIKNDITQLLPYRVLYAETEDEKYSDTISILESGIKGSCAPNYYIAALARLNLDKLIKNNEISSAIAVFVHNYIENMYFTSSMDITEIRRFLNGKISDDKPMTLEELCFIFIDDYFKNFRVSCFRNFLDDTGIFEPLDIISNTLYKENVVNFFLYRICSVEMLVSLYLVFDSSLAAQDYRIKICEFLLTRYNKNRKNLKHELEALTKEKALHKRLTTVNRSRVSINSSAIEASVYEEFEYQIETSKISMSPKQIDKDTVFIFCPQADSFIYMYNIYAKTFCFSTHGLDTSLSTRVRHGSFINQVFRIFGESKLIYEQGKNDFIDDIIASGNLNEDITDMLDELRDNIQAKLQFFTQHTLKVFVDTPIDGALFDFSEESIKDELYKAPQFIDFLLNIDKTNAKNIIDFFHSFMSEKTEEYLMLIREKYLVSLEKELINLLDDFSAKCTNCSNDITTTRNLLRNITQCKTSLQSEFAVLKTWFYLSENEIWEDFTYNDLLEICLEISKKLFPDFDKVTINKNIDATIEFNGKLFRNLIDIILIMLNNAFSHSGFEHTPQNLVINCNQFTDENYVYFQIENNLHSTVDIESLENKIAEINRNYTDQVFKSLNTRQEGGMGLLKTMSILNEMAETNDSFYISMQNHKIKIEIKLRKELCINEKNIIS